MKWEGVIPAITTAFRDDLEVDHEFIGRHASWMIDAGCTGIVAPGSLGEGATLEFDEKIAVLRTLVEAVGDRVPVASAVSSLSTAEAVHFAKASADAGCKGLMVLPPYVYSTDWREMRAHVTAIMEATSLSCMLYNNPVAYKTDFLPEHVAELAREYEQLHAVKESSTDVRRISAIRSLIGDRLAISVGVDDVLLEGVAAGAIGWIAGLVNAYPVESVRLFEFARAGETEKAFAIYRWFLPLLRLDTVPKFVQLVKLVQSEVGMGSETVRPPRLKLEGAERAEALAVIENAKANKPEVSA